MKEVLMLLFLFPVKAFSLELVLVPSGALKPLWSTVMTSSEKSKSTNLIEVRSFYAMKYAVTKKDFSKFLDKNPKWQKNNIAKIFADDVYLKSFEQTPERSPVTEVSWFAAKAFCESHNMRLPTLLEWEYVAAASETESNANQDSHFLRRILDWYGEPQGKSIKPVGSIYKNKYGLWDMHGLIWEWIDDFNSSFVTGESREDGTLNKNMFCGSGGTAGANKEDYASFMRFAFRSGLTGKASVWNLGFRCVRSL